MSDIFSYNCQLQPGVCHYNQEGKVHSSNVIPLLECNDHFSSHLSILVL